MNCPNCKADLDVEEEELEEGDPVSCDECAAELRVASIHPLELEPVDDDADDEDEEEDEDDEDFEEDEDEDELEEEEEEDEWS